MKNDCINDFIKAQEKIKSVLIESYVMYNFNTNQQVNYFLTKIKKDVFVVTLRVISDKAVTLKLSNFDCGSDAMLDYSIKRLLNGLSINSLNKIGITNLSELEKITSDNNNNSSFVNIFNNLGFKILSANI